MGHLNGGQEIKIESIMIFLLKLCKVWIARKWIKKEKLAGNQICVKDGSLAIMREGE